MTAAPRARAVIDLAALSSNVAVLADSAGDAALMAVVKADAYGHGLVPCARAAREAGAEWLGVALLEEALELRAAGDGGRILAWLAVPGDRFPECIAADIDLAAYDQRMLAEIVAGSESVGRAARVHLKVDTGLSRGGAVAADWPELCAAAREAERAGAIRVVGVWSHLAYADIPTHPTVTAQLDAFDVALEEAEAAGLRPEVRHIANSAATLAVPRARYDLVRPGIAVYGISPGPDVGSEADLGLTAVMTLRSSAVLVKRVPAGSGVSYGHTYTVTDDADLLLLPVGYADGIPRAASNVGPVLVGGTRRRISGRVCMDQVVIDLQGLAARAGDEVVLFGDGATGAPTAAEWADVTGTIGYEIVTRVGPRVPRVVVDTRTL